MENKQKHTQFVPGIKLAEGFFHQEVKPILQSHYPDLDYSAALIGSGSEVLEFDTEMSVDHQWGPRVMLFLHTDDFTSKRDTIRTVLGNELPLTYLGYSTNFSEPDPEDHGVQYLKPSTSRPINHDVKTYTLESFFLNYMNIHIEEELEPVDWLTLPHQKLRSVTAGCVFHDGLGLNKIRARFSWYPYDVWLYILASCWARIGQEEHLMGRAGFVNDEIGSALLGSRLVRDIMRLVFLMEKEYPPYPKWFGTAFSHLKSAIKLGPILTNVVHSSSWQEREESLCKAYEIVAGIHNSLGITAPISTKVSQFFSRPFKIIGGEKITNAIVERIHDPKIVPLTKRSLIGSIDMLSDNTDLLEDPSFRLALKALYI